MPNSKFFRIRKKTLTSTQVNIKIESARSLARQLISSVKAKTLTIEEVVNMATLIYCINRSFGNVSEHFNAKEMASKDGSDELLVSTDLIAILEKIREHFSKPVIINSGYRTPNWNSAVGGSGNSYHCKGMAADIRIKGVSTGLIAKYADELMENYGGVIRYSNFVHVDVREVKYRKGV